MPTNPPERQAPHPDSPVITWLLDSDPSIRWQVMRDLTYTPAEIVAAERSRTGVLARPGTRLNDSAYCRLRMK